MSHRAGWAGELGASVRCHHRARNCIRPPHCDTVSNRFYPDARMIAPTSASVAAALLALCACASLDNPKPTDGTAVVKGGPCGKVYRGGYEKWFRLASRRCAGTRNCRSRSVIGQRGPEATQPVALAVRVRRSRLKNTIPAAARVQTTTAPDGRSSQTDANKPTPYPSVATA
jgi:hypothetical protein